jgi:predicted Zn-dependent protease
MRTTIAALLLGTAALLAACATTAPEAEPVSDNPAVQSLVDRARSDIPSGRFGDAVAVMERALRIEPRNPRLWLEYARIRMDQSQYGQAENLALRADSYAGGDRRLRRAIWNLIGDTRDRRGDAEGAAAARAKAHQL